MNKKLLFVFALMLLISFSFVSAVTVNAPYTLDSLDSGYTARTGMRINPNVDFTLDTININSNNVNVNNWYILDSSKSVLDSGSIVSNQATGIGYAMTSGTTYYLAFDDGGGSYNLYRYVGTSYPQTDTNLDWTGGLGQSGGVTVDVTNVAYIIDSIEISFGSSAHEVTIEELYFTPNATIYKDSSITGTVSINDTTESPQANFYLKVDNVTVENKTTTSFSRLVECLRNHYKQHSI